MSSTKQASKLRVLTETQWFDLGPQDRVPNRPGQYTGCQKPCPLPFTDEPRLGSDVVLSVAFSSLFVLVNTYSKSDRPSS